MARSRRARLGRALENTSALHLSGRTWDDPFDGDPDGTEKSLVVEVEPFPTEMNGTIVLGNSSSPAPGAGVADSADDSDTN